MLSAILILLLLVEGMENTIDEPIFSSCVTKEGNDVTSCEIYKSIQSVDDKLSKLTMELTSNCPNSLPTFELSLEAIQEELKASREVANEFGKLKNEIMTKFQENQKSITKEFNDYKTKMESIVKEYKDVIKKNSADISTNRNSFARCVTDIQFSGLEKKGIWKNSGYHDNAGEGYVITEVFNWNGDELVDDVGRRKLQMKRGNGWSNVHT